MKDPAELNFPGANFLGADGMLPLVRWSLAELLTSRPFPAATPSLLKPGNHTPGLFLLARVQDIGKLAQRGREVPEDVVRVEGIEEAPGEALDLLVVPVGLLRLRVVEHVGKGKECFVVSEVLGRGHGRRDRGGPGAQLGNGIGCSGPAEGSAVCGDVIGLAIRSLDIPGVRPDGD